MLVEEVAARAVLALVDLCHESYMELGLDQFSLYHYWVTFGAVELLPATEGLAGWTPNNHHRFLLIDKLQSTAPLYFPSEVPRLTVELVDGGQVEREARYESQ